MGIANRVKVGGEDTAFAGCLYFLATGLLLGLRDWSRLPYYGERLAKGVLLLLLLLYSALALGTCIGPYLFTRFLIPEVLVALWMALGFLFFLKSLEQPEPSRWVCWG